MNFSTSSEHSAEICRVSLDAVRDTLYVLNGKWKLPIIISLTEQGPQRFAALQRILGDITPKILSKELKDLELNEFITREVFPTKPVTVVYSITPYSASVKDIISAMREWGLQHKQRLLNSSRKKGAAAAGIPAEVTA
ncbi:transcriptional regulator, HxlR family [Chitinophaga costaii]|uniref:Transcriptional regulator, HxlR family n=1 Tax=Chitinophaga costaii TaxID=1335309 RepID=A0A1C3Z0H3_9BACT|nr:helix-turn-helix domain-containing protein [Chitinophaga costaii]PUZ30179.1 transcriptional regulator [Chitinophaga costaii]SCB75760.1 transcriptional regulator, HxlR family [Chitinophaga costaii]